MALSVRGVDVMSFGEFAVMIAGLQQGAESTGVLQAWYAGEAVEPADLYVCLAVECRLRASTLESEEVIEGALARLEKYFAEEIRS